MHTSFIQRLPSLLLFFVIVLTINSCKKEDAAVSETCRVTSQYYMNGTVPFYTLYNYDSQGRVISTFGTQIYSFLTYNADSALYKEYQTGNGSLNNTYSLKVDSKGRFITQDNRTFQYDTEGHLIRQVSGTITYDYTWQDGNMVSSTTSFSGVPGYTNTYTYYTDRENKARWDYNHSGINCFFGQASKNLIKHISSEQLSNGNITETDWTYEYNEKGLPTEMTILFVGSGTFDTYYYSYECN